MVDLIATSPALEYLAIIASSPALFSYLTLYLLRLYIPTASKTRLPQSTVGFVHVDVCFVRPETFVADLVFTCRRRVEECCSST